MKFKQTKTLPKQYGETVREEAARRGISIKEVRRQRNATRIETQRLYALNALADYEREMLGDDYPLLEGHEIGNK